MPIGMGIFPLLKMSVDRRIGLTFFAHALKQGGIAYKWSELADAYSREWGASVKRDALAGMDVDDYPSPTEIIERPMLQRDKYHITGVINYWDRETGMLGQKWMHVYTDQVGTVAQYNQMLIDAYQEEAEADSTEPAKLGKLVTSGILTQVEHNEGWEY